MENGRGKVGQGQKRDERKKRKNKSSRIKKRPGYRGERKYTYRKEGMWVNSFKPNCENV